MTLARCRKTNMGRPAYGKPMYLWPALFAAVALLQHAGLAASDPQLDKIRADGGILVGELEYNLHPGWWQYAVSCDAKYWASLAAKPGSCEPQIHDFKTVVAPTLFKTQEFTVPADGNIVAYSEINREEGHEPEPLIYVTLASANGSQTTVSHSILNSATPLKSPRNYQSLKGDKIIIKIEARKRYYSAKNHFLPVDTKVWVYLIREPVMPVPPKGEIYGVVTDSGEINDISGILPGKGHWNLDEQYAHGIAMAVEYMRKRANELYKTDKNMADFLNLYADRILAANISYQEKPLLGDGEASCSFFGDITVYKKMGTYAPISRPIGPLDSYDDEDLGVLASLLIHEVAHSHGAKEWQAHLIQKNTFDALKVSPDAGTRVHNQKYFETFHSPYDPRAQFIYTFWMNLHSSSRRQ